MTRPTRRVWQGADVGQVVRELATDDRGKLIVVTEHRVPFWTRMRVRAQLRSWVLFWSWEEA